MRCALSSAAWSVCRPARARSRLMHSFSSTLRSTARRGSTLTRRASSTAVSATPCPRRRARSIRPPRRCSAAKAFLRRPLFSSARQRTPFAHHLSIPTFMSRLCGSTKSATPMSRRIWASTGLGSAIRQGSGRRARSSSSRLRALDGWTVGRGRMKRRTVFRHEPRHPHRSRCSTSCPRSRTRSRLPSCRKILLSCLCTHDGMARRGSRGLLAEAMAVSRGTHECIRSARLRNASADCIRGGQGCASHNLGWAGGTHQAVLARHMEGGEVGRVS
mmetsp:Transcript_71082/g.140894  ORF Transcript_71082/g.140894 Transcript_71082/m.140894 type:complete len:274 (-) Transcript_71082:305-1126(-)